jgi:TIR domain
MRIFLSFASEHEQVAEAILLALRDRGHSVFFSKDDLPPAETYDARIQRGVQASDFMIYLVSPESVTRGRYTLTELSFARQRWPNPNGHLLPVLVAPTPLDTIPAYLKAVTILEPLGNIAAETSAEVDKLSIKWHHGTIIRFGLFGIVAALCSYFSILLFPPEIMIDPGLNQRPKFPYLQISSAPILPGLFFGLLVAACAELSPNLGDGRGQAAAA